jgi:hypothetical protein
MTEGPLIEGIPSLGPGDSRKIVWGQYYGLKKALGDEQLIVTCEYKHGKTPNASSDCRVGGQLIQRD